MREKVKKSPSSLRSGKCHALRLTVTATSSPVCFVREVTRAGAKSGLDFVEGDVDARGVDKGMAPGVVALESSEEGNHTCLLMLIPRKLSCRGL